MDFIKATNLTFEYMKNDGSGLSGTRAIDDISFSVRKGSFTAIIGQNGSGKSTLAKNINALLVPTSGSITVDGMDTSDAENVWKVRQKVAMVFQNPDNQIVSSIVEDDVAFGPENLGVDPKEIRERVDKALLHVEMDEYKKKAPHLLSGGQKQRIAIAGALAMQPEGIVFDEPTAMLDPRGRRDLMNVIGTLHGMGITTVLITHFMEEAAQADQIIVMDRGKIRMDGTPEEIFSRADELKELNLGVPAAVELGMILRERGFAIPENLVTEEELVECLREISKSNRVK